MLDLRRRPVAAHVQRSRGRVPRRRRRRTTTSTPRASTSWRTRSVTTYVVTDNLFGDILTDLAGAVVGGVGLAGTGNLNPDRTTPSMFEPVHGSAHDALGTDKVNATAQIKAAALMLEFLGEADAGARIRKAVDTRAGDQSRSVHHWRRRRRRPLRSYRNAYYPDKEDLDGRRARRLGRRQDSRAHPHAALRHGRVRRRARLRNVAGPRRVPPHRSHRAAASTPRRSSAWRSRSPSTSWSRPRRKPSRSTKLDVVLHPSARVPRLRRDGSQPASVRGEGVDRVLAVGLVPR